jgi:hypothetical protein
MGATSATSLGEFIAIPPMAVSLSRAARLGSNPTTESPDLIRFPAIADPMMPIPMIPTGSLTSDSSLVHHASAARAALPQRFGHHIIKRIGRRTRAEAGHDILLPALLCERSEWPSDCGSADKRDKLPSPHGMWSRRGNR